MAGEAGGVTRVMDELMNQIYIERGGTLYEREQNSLVERHDVEREKAEQRETCNNPFFTASPSRRFHNALRLSAAFYVLFNFKAAVLQASL